MKAVISNRIYLAYDKELFESLKKELTYVVPSKIFGEPPEVKTTIKRIGTRAISLPVGRVDLIPEESEIVDKRIINPWEFPEFKFTLRESQKIIYDKVTDNCLINANCAWGKTFTSLAIATKLEQKTLIIVHNISLRKQWEEEIEKVLGITPGIIGGGKVNHNSPITVANIQTLRSRALGLKDEFGLIIVDEVHHAPAKEFEDTLNIFRARYKIGLSATLERKDGLHVVLPDYFGMDVYTTKIENQMVPKVMIIKTFIPFSSNMTVPWANRVNELVANPDYLQIVTDLAKSYGESGHKVLIVSDRTEFLEQCFDLREEHARLVIGSTKVQERAQAHFDMESNTKTRELYGAISIYKEGISENYLSCLINAAPTNNDPLMKQLTGRILREYPGKLQPIIVDIVLKGSTARRQSQARAAFYMDQGWEIMYADLT
jgi:superfamily II DNA or RNA helicase